MHSNEARRRFVSDLKKAAEIYSEKAGNPRDGLILSIQAAGRYLAALDVDTRLSAPFYALYFSLISLDAGSRPPLLSPTKVDHRPPTDMLTEVGQTYAALVLELRFQSGVGLDEAAARTLRGISKWPQFEGKPPTKKQLMGWRENASVEMRTTEHGKRYHDQLDKLSKFDADPARLADALEEVGPYLLPGFPIKPHS